jgi:hypothetical protein
MTRVGIEGSEPIDTGRISSFPVEPGDDRVGLNAQGDSCGGTALILKAAAGQTFYLFLSPREEGARWKLDEIDPARGLFLLASSGLSTAQAKN